MKKSIILFFILLGAASQAQEKKWTLLECIQYALENNISVKQSELDVKLSEVDKLTAIGNFLPNLNASANVANNTGLSFNPVTNNAQTTTFFSASGRINLGYTLFDGLKNFRQVQRAKLANLAAGYNLSNMKNNIALTIANNYIQILLNEANRDVLLSQNDVTQEQLQRTQDLVDAGILPQGDLLEIKATDAREKQSIVAADNAVQISLVSLAQLLLIKDYQNFKIEEKEYVIIDETIIDKSVYEVIQGAKNDREDITSNINVKLAEKDLQIARSSNFPTLSAFFGYDTRYTDATSFTQAIDQNNPVITQQIGVVEGTGQAVIGEFPNTVARIVGADPFINQLYQNDGIAYGLQLNIPIFNGFAVKGNIQRSKINLERARYEAEQVALNLESTVYQAYVDAKAALKTYEASQLAVESQQLAYEYAKERYDVGLTNSFDFSQSKTRFDNSKIELNRAKYDYVFKLKVLEVYFGVSLDELKF